MCELFGVNNKLRFTNCELQMTLRNRGFYYCDVCRFEKLSKQ